MIEHIKTTNPIFPFRFDPEPSKLATFTPVVLPPLELELGIGLNDIVLLPITTAVAEIPRLRTVPPMVIGGPPGASVPPEIRNSVCTFAVIGEALKVMTGRCCVAKAVDSLETTLGDTDASGDSPAA